MTLQLPRDIQIALTTHARRNTPQEVVGVLGGHRTSDHSIVQRHYPAENAADNPDTKYEIAPADAWSLFSTIDDTGQDIVGFYHSHPHGPPAPSDIDRHDAAWPGFSYVIVSLAGSNPTVASWRWTGEVFRQEPITLKQAQRLGIQGGETCRRVEWPTARRR